MRAFPLWLKTSILLIVGVMVAGGIGLYFALRQRIIHEVDANLEAIAQLKVSQISDWRTARKNEAAVMTASPYFIQMVTAWTQKFKTDNGNMLLRFGIMQQHYQTKDILLVSTSGEIYLRLSNRTDKLCETTINAMETAFRTRKPVVSDLYIAPGESQPQLDVVAPFFIQRGNTFIPQNAILYRYDPGQYLYPRLRIWPVPSQTAETLIVRRENDAVLFLNDLRHQNIKAFSLRLPLSRTDLPSVMAVQGQRGIVRGKDYRGVIVMAALRDVPDTPWYLVAKIDEEEALSALKRESALIFGMVLFLIVSVSAVIGVLWQRNDNFHYRALFEAENAQRKIEARYRSTLDGLAEGCQIIDYEWRYLYINATAIHYSGHPENELLSQTLLENFPGIETTPEFAAYNRCMTERTPQTLVGSIDFPDGERWYEYSIQPIPEGIFVLSTDITDRKKSEADRALLASAIEQSGEVIIIIDTKGIVQYVNPIFEAVTGKKREEAMGKPLPQDNIGSQDEAFFKSFWDTISSGKVWRGRIINHKKDGTSYTEEVTVSPVFNASGAITNYVSVSRDITEFLRLQNDKEKLQAQFLQSQKIESVGRLAGGVAHDFNNMLSVILGHTQLSLDAINDSHPLSLHLQEINKAAQRSADLTRQLLAFARKQTISPKVLDLNETISGLLTMLQRLIGEDIDLAWLPGSNLWPIRMDPAQVNQIMTNLAVNSRDAIEQVGRITIETENLTLDADYCADHPGFVAGDFVVLSASDNGRGMEKEILNHLFEPFFTTKKVGEGTGLGLATVYGIVKQNDGFINVYSEPGRGTTFKVYFPKAVRLPAEEKEIVPPAPPKGGTETIFLVEDEPAVQKLTKIMLERLGYTVIAASAPNSAIRLAGEYAGEIHLLLVDVVMPEMTGRDLSEQLHSIRPNLKRLFMSGYTANVIAHHGVLDKGVHFIQKPFTAKMLADKVREALES
jgi:two-component system, cell cycle sensor histidine kinase and response regulator CckA